MYYNLYLKLPSEIFWKFTNSKDSGMTIMARQPIGKGDPIYHSYAREFTTTTFRRLILFSGILILQNILNYSNNNIINFIISVKNIININVYFVLNY